MDRNIDGNFSRKLNSVKKVLDRFLPLILLLLSFYLYLELFANQNTFFYSYKWLLQYVLMFYFLLDLAVLFLLYEDNRKFFRNHWLDILLTIPFITALKGLKAFKFAKLSKVMKTSKAGKTVKTSQKLGKLVKKLKKQVKKYREN